MGLLDRMSTVVQAKMNKIMDKIEDPRESLNLSYGKQLELLQNVKRGVAEATTSKKTIELQKEKLQMSIHKLDAQAKEAVQANREDLARKALENKAALRPNQLPGPADSRPEKPATKAYGCREPPGDKSGILQN